MHRNVWARCVFSLLISLFATPIGHAQEAQSACNPKPAQQGCGTITWPDGSTFTGNFRNGLFSGHARVVYADGAEFEGEFTDGVGGGLASFAGPGGIRISGSFKDGEIDIARTPKDAIGDFPFWRRMKKDEANIRIFAIVTDTGDVTNVMADIPNTFSDTDVTALNAALSETILKWKCRPAMIDNQPVRSPAVFSISYSNPE